MGNPRNLSTQLEEWATRLKNDLFSWARLRLSLFYIAVVALILVSFSTVLYFSLAGQVRDNLEIEAVDNQTELRVVERTLDRLQILLVVINGSILIVVAGASWILAGKTLQPIHESLQRQKEFTADASHELRTPLAIMKTDSEIVRRDKTANLLDYYKVTNSNLEEIKRMETLIDDLLLLARSDKEQEIIQRTAISLTVVVKEAGSFLETYGKKKGVKLELQIENDVSILGDKTKMKQAIINILKNAFDHTPFGGVVTIVLSRERHRAILRITDTGIGIPQQHLPYIFERFYRIDKARSRNKGSTGLGLAITKKIVEAHNGCIFVKSIPGKGTSFTLSFPILQTS